MPRSHVEAVDGAVVVDRDPRGPIDRQTEEGHVAGYGLQRADLDGVARFDRHDTQGAVAEMLHSLCRGRGSSRGSGGLSLRGSLRSPGGGRIGLSLSRGGLSLSRFQGRLELGDDLGVYRSLGCGHGLVEGCLGRGGGVSGLLSPGGGRIGLSLGRGGLSLSRGGLSLSRSRGGLSLGLGRGGVGVRNALIVAARRGYEAESEQHRQPAEQVLPVSHLFPPRVVRPQPEDCSARVAEQSPSDGRLGSLPDLSRIPVQNTTSHAV